MLALQGDVLEHIETTKNAALKMRKDIDIVSVRTKKDLEGLTGLIIPGGESTTLYKLCEREGIFEEEGRKKAIASLAGKRLK